MRRKIITIVLAAAAFLLALAGKPAVARGAASPAASSDALVQR